MPTIGMTGNDTIIINNRSMTDIADGNVIELSYPNDIAAIKTGKNGNAIYALNESGKQAELKLKLIRGSDDDKFMNDLIIQQSSNFAAFPLMIGSFVKKMGDGKGNVTNDTYICGGGIFSKQPEAKSNVEGDTEQGTITYMLKFSNAPRSIA